MGITADPGKGRSSQKPQLWSPVLRSLFSWWSRALGTPTLAWTWRESQFPPESAGPHNSLQFPCGPFSEIHFLGRKLKQKGPAVLFVLLLSLLVPSLLLCHSCPPLVSRMLCGPASLFYANQGLCPFPFPIRTVFLANQLGGVQFFPNQSGEILLQASIHNPISESCFLILVSVYSHLPQAISIPQCGQLAHLSVCLPFAFSLLLERHVHLGWTLRVATHALWADSHICKIG